MRLYFEIEFSALVELAISQYVPSVNVSAMAVLGSSVCLTSTLEMFGRRELSGE
jgi:hypothetical protein